MKGEIPVDPGEDNDMERTHHVMGTEKESARRIQCLPKARLLLLQTPLSNQVPDMKVQ